MLAATDPQLDRLIPPDKSWALRMGMLDLIHGAGEPHEVFARDDAPDDLRAFGQAFDAWRAGTEPVPVGESGTLYRFLRFYGWKHGLQKTLVKSGTLAGRAITDDPGIVTWSQDRLLKLDNGTSQWASAAVLCGDTERLTDPPVKLALTYQAVGTWQPQAWEARPDPTIRRQAEAALGAASGAPVSFTPLHSEDFPLARVLGTITTEAGRRRWPSLAGHESDRLREVDQALAQYRLGQSVTSRDHRVVQATAILGAVERTAVTFEHPDSVSKSWPRFWEFVDVLEDQR